MSSAMDSMFNPSRGGSGGGGSGGSVNVINNLNSSSPTDALSAGMGKNLNETIQAHEQLIAGVGANGDLGHVKVDGTTITIDSTTGVISSTGGSSSNSVAYRQAIIPTTIIDQVQWKIPFTDYKHPDDLLIVSQNSTLLNTDEYSITQNSDGVSWDINYNYTPDPQYPLAPENNTMFVIIIKGGSGGGGGSTFPQPAIKQFIAETLVDPLGGFHYKIASYIPQATDKFEINFNTTTLTSAMYTLSNDGVDTYIKLLVQESATQSKNNVAGTIYRNFDAF